MKILKNSLQRLRFALVALGLILSLAVSCLWNPGVAQAANFVMKTGYYMGNGVSGLTISGLGFQPDYIMIKSSTAAGVAVFKTSAMPANTMAYTSATANDTATNITFTATGFSVGTLAAVNSLNVLYTYIAIGGSDCSATGNFCVGTYTGNGAGNRNIAVGFQPDMALVKRSTAVDGHFRVASEPANESLFFTTTARDTTGAYIRAFSAGNFQVGTTDNTNTAVYYYAVFKATAGSFAQGTYAGNGADNRSIAGTGFKPNFVMVKNATSVTAASRSPLTNNTYSHGDSSSYVGVATANLVNAIQLLEANGFQVGTAAQTNENGATLYWFAFGGEAADSTTGSFSMATGSYTGTGASNVIASVGFAPDLVIIKAVTTQAAVFRSRVMQGDVTAHTALATANFAGGITSLDASGFTVGTATQTNTAGVVYHWQAFGNGYDPYSRTGASDFAIGAFYGNGILGRNITGVPWQPNMVTVKRNGATAGIWRSSALTGDLTSSFTATAETAGMVQALNTDGFRVGTNTAVNSSANVYYWFAFKTGSNFSVGSYTGNGTSQNITGLGFRPEDVWVKRSTAVNAVQSAISLGPNVSQYFAATANVTDRIAAYVKGGFSVTGTATETNTNAGVYRWAAWNNPNYTLLSVDIVDGAGVSVPSPTIAMNAKVFNFTCTPATGTLGAASQKLRISNISYNPLWTLSIAATNGPTELWRTAGDTARYDFNDASGAGCSDGADADSSIGQMNLTAAGASVAPETGCTTTDLNLLPTTGFAQGTVDSAEIVSTGGSANPDCIWDITGVGLSQTIPPEQTTGSYNINLTVTIISN